MGPSSDTKFNHGLVSDFPASKTVGNKLQIISIIHPNAFCYSNGTQAKEIRIFQENDATLILLHNKMIPQKKTPGCRGERNWLKNWEAAPTLTISPPCLALSAEKTRPEFLEGSLSDII